MEKYLGVKLIEAEPMTRGDYNKFKGWKIPENENPNDEGYIVKYSDDYISWSPREAFEEAYREIHGLTFGLAVEALKKGYKVARTGWNGKGMFVYYVPTNTYTTVTGVAKNHFGDQVTINAYFSIKNVNDTVSTWVPSINDCLAEDWLIVE